MPAAQSRAALLALRLGDSFKAIVDSVPWEDAVGDAVPTPGEKRRIVAEVLLAAEEYGGCRLPRQPLQLNDALTTKTFPAGVPALTTKGLVRFYEGRGWRYMVFHVPQLVRAFLGQNERLQEVLALYEAQCATDGVEPVPVWADGPGVAGGTGETSPFAEMVARAEVFPR